MPRPRLRELGITIGTLPTGPHNAITDVEGVWVGHTTLLRDEPRVARTGVTVIVPRAGDILANHSFAAYHSFNGNGVRSAVLAYNRGVIALAHYPQPQNDRQRPR